jgi:hypothetical protein
VEAGYDDLCQRCFLNYYGFAAWKEWREGTCTLETWRLQRQPPLPPLLKATEEDYRVFDEARRGWEEGWHDEFTERARRMVHILDQAARNIRMADEDAARAGQLGEAGWPLMEEGPDAPGQGAPGHGTGGAREEKEREEKGQTEMQTDEENEAFLDEIDPLPLPPMEAPTARRRSARLQAQRGGAQVEQQVAQPVVEQQAAQSGSDMEISPVAPTAQQGAQSNQQGAPTEQQSAQQ